jgi:hypothetical protein
VDAGSSPPDMTVINPVALECNSRICLAATPNTSNVMNSDYMKELPVCTARCDTDDDCNGGLVSKTDMRLCHSSFKCAVATEIGPFCCLKLCICADYLQPPIITSSACDPSIAANKMRCPGL